DSMRSCDVGWQRQVLPRCAVITGDRVDGRFRRAARIAKVPVARSQPNAIGFTFWSPSAPVTATRTGCVHLYVARSQRTKRISVSDLSPSPFGSIDSNAIAGSPFSSRAIAVAGP